MIPATSPPALVPAPDLALQVSATGGSAVLAALALLSLAVAAGLSLLIAYEALKGYRGTRDRAMLFLAVGIVLLTGGPIALRIALPTLTDTPESVRLLSTTVSELLGLGCILYAIYGRP
ncbi:hypothetical protein HZS55_09910 [Halosimplex rubrum]|uniref:Uncharacterized protein n=1 Tax=Halosimplex rubrum TaxID=869889 RepID=A0A7D5TLK4_9EURY|nr:hypothetical protein [Halosimplex rubrum]QLH77592.1 hypothetical protein HZS55_09910 [Halosimplex rubrum]